MTLIDKALPAKPDAADLLGMVTVGRTAYQVYRVAAGPNCQREGMRFFALIGPRGASYLVTDHGPRYALNSCACGGGQSWAPAPRSLRGLTREHLQAFAGTP